MSPAERPDTDLVLHTVRQLVVAADDERIAGLTDAINGVAGRTVADILCAFAAMMAETLTGTDEDTRDALWCAFQALVLGHVTMSALMQRPPDAPLN